MLSAVLYDRPQRRSFIVTIANDKPRFGHETITARRAPLSL